VGLLIVDTWGRRPAFLLSSGGSFVFYGLLTGVLMAVDFLPTFELTAPVVALVHSSLILAYVSVQGFQGWSWSTQPSPHPATPTCS
jgi:hypothetical protein